MLAAGKRISIPRLTVETKLLYFVTTTGIKEISCCILTGVYLLSSMTELALRCNAAICACYRRCISFVLACLDVNVSQGDRMSLHEFLCVTLSGTATEVLSESV